MRQTTSRTSPVRRPRPVSAFPDLEHPWALADDQAADRPRISRPIAIAAAMRRHPAGKRRAA